MRRCINLGSRPSLHHPSALLKSISTKTPPRHHDLKSFLNYYAGQIDDQLERRQHAQHVYEVDGWSPDLGAWRRPVHDITDNHVFRGTRYEYMVKDRLGRDYGLDLMRVGGRGDAGVDLVGSWRLPVPEGRGALVRVLVQCKRLASNRTPTPAQLRELEGAMNSAFTDDGRVIGSSSTVLSWQEYLSTTSAGQVVENQNLPTLGVFVTTRGWTKGIQKAIAASQRALMFIALDERGEDGNRIARLSVPDTKLVQMVWNQAANKIGMEGFNVGLFEQDAGNGEAVLQWRSQSVKRLNR